ncbi:p24 complex component [Geranomyces variabilis]|nr:p24 complex component [Geranomyces variabilis]
MKYLHVALAALAVCLLCATLPVAAFNTFTIILGPRQENCFTEHLQAQDRLDLSYEVAEGGSLDIDFVVYSPNSRPLYNQNGKSFGTFGFNAEIEGSYVYCFSNKQSSASEKRLAFTVHGPDEIFKIEEKEMKESIDDPTDTIQAELRILDSGIKAIRDEHAFLTQRERRHRLTADSTNARAMYWSLVQACCLMGVCYFQISYLKRFFDMRRVRV